MHHAPELLNHFFLQTAELLKNGVMEDSTGTYVGTSRYRYLSWMPNGVH